MILKPISVSTVRHQLSDAGTGPVVELISVAAVRRCTF